MQNAHPVIDGVFKPRDTIITVIDLAKYLGLPSSPDVNHDIYIIANFNSHNFAFMERYNQTEILLESGTNELEIVEFTINGELLGINVAKVIEIMRYIIMKWAFVKFKIDINNSDKISNKYKQAKNDVGATKFGYTYIVLFLLYIATESGS